jgi:hypothetical protein
VAFACPRNVYFSDAPLSHGDVLHLHFYRPPCVGRRDPIRPPLSPTPRSSCSFSNPYPSACPPNRATSGPTVHTVYNFAEGMGTKWSECGDHHFRGGRN